MSTISSIPNEKAHRNQGPYESEILTPEVMHFLSSLGTRFEAQRLNLLEQRRLRQAQFDAGVLPDFLPETRCIREAEWKVAPPPADLLDRRVEITGPTDRKMVINALNSGARVFMADFEDSTAPSWANCLDGQHNLRDANARKISYTSPEGKRYQLNDAPAVLFVRPRGWHMTENHWPGATGSISASLFDFGVYFLHNLQTLLNSGTAPYFYLPKIESHLEARLWNDVFNFAEDFAAVPRGTIRATVLIETITAAFEMDEILFELREHSVGLNCGRWDYIFSFIKKFSARASFVLPQRGDVTMEQPFLRSYVRLLIKTCHRRGAHAMGGMAAQIPIRNDAQANAEAMERVRLDKLREVKAGHDGTWVAHPGLVPLAMQVFDEHMPGPNQVHSDLAMATQVTASDLLEIPKGRITLEGFTRNVDISLMYLESWLRGVGCVPIYNLMEDAATAEISRAQLWQWQRYGARTEDGTLIDQALIAATIQSTLAEKRQRMGDVAYRDSKFPRAAEVLWHLVSGTFPQFLTTGIYADLKD